MPVISSIWSRMRSQRLWRTSASGLAGHELGVAGDHGHRIAQVVGDAGEHAADDGEALGVDARLALVG